MGDRRPLLGRLSDTHTYGIAFVLVVAQFVLLAAGGEGLWVRIAWTALTTALVVFVYVTAGFRSRLKRVVSLVALACIVIVLSSLAFDPDVTRGLTGVLNALLTLAVASVILRAIARQLVVDTRTVLGAMTIYLMIGLGFASTYAAIGAFDPQPFFASGRSETIAHFVYFSYITQTTVGFGDFTAATNLGRTFTIVEALTGQLYLVTIVALVVGNLGRTRRRAEPSTDG